MAKKGSSLSLSLQFAFDLMGSLLAWKPCARTGPEAEEDKEEE
jgi:hypothetical protein